MTLRILISLSLLLLAWQKAGAQLAPPDDFFNSGAQLYISNNVPAALERVENGLKTYPDDEKLKRLEKLLKQQQQQQQQQSSPQNSQDQKKQDEEKQKQAEQKKEDEQKKQEEQQAAAPKKDGEKQDKPDTEGQVAKPGQITPEEAKRLLDAQKGDEQLLQMKPKEKPKNPLRPVKDW
jgi:Skp family chaperone for outer membrane proteins